LAGKRNKGAERLLKLKGNIWWFRRQIPDDVRYAADGRGWLFVNLHTSDVVEAKKSRDDLEALSRLQFRQVQAGARSVLEIPGWSTDGAHRLPSPAERGTLARTAIEAAGDAPDESAGDECDNLSPTDLAVIAAEQEAERLKPSDTFGKRFRRFRLLLDVDDRLTGVRRSLVNFLSARRWFVTQARHADQPRETIADVVGHKPDKRDTTFGKYAREASWDQRRACVEAVKLPHTERTYS
jgi:hypothetical protein